ncbi:hypothetical protein Salat_2452600 [Sesamum alatum]|uniref:Uncharacterized protein n=1 Tax=Sesamum alatum TaxID=300844 RepID=A0AAE2CBS1_9LAMI|nr:hypothetical protein Salat_2452600 [Sesamum alatum]
MDRPLIAVKLQQQHFKMITAKVKGSSFHDHNSVPFTMKRIPCPRRDGIALQHGPAIPFPSRLNHNITKTKYDQKQWRTNNNGRLRQRRHHSLCWSDCRLHIVNGHGVDHPELVSLGASTSPLGDCSFWKKLGPSNNCVQNKTGTLPYMHADNLITQAEDATEKINSRKKLLCCNPVPEVATKYGNL